MNPPQHLSDFGDLDTETLLQYLPGVNFPAEKEQVASTAESNNAPQDMVWRIRNARTQRYVHPDNVLEALTGRRVFCTIARPRGDHGGEGP